jgi:hypothetical protein
VDGDELALLVEGRRVTPATIAITHIRREPPLVVVATFVALLDARPTDPHDRFRDRWDGFLFRTVADTRVAVWIRLHSIS